MVVVLLVGIVLINAGGHDRAQATASFLAAAAPFIDPGDAVTLLTLSDLRRHASAPSRCTASPRTQQPCADLAPDWKSWDNADEKFPDGFSLGGAPWWPTLSWVLIYGA